MTTEAETRQLEAALHSLSRRIKALEESLGMMATIVGIATAASDRPLAPGATPITLTAALLTGITAAEMQGRGSQVLEALRSGIQVASQTPEPDGDGTPLPIADNVVELLRKAA